MKQPVGEIKKVFEISRGHFGFAAARRFWGRHQEIEDRLFTAGHNKSLVVCCPVGVTRAGTGRANISKGWMAVENLQLPALAANPSCWFVY